VGANERKHIALHTLITGNKAIANPTVTLGSTSLCRRTGINCKTDLQLVHELPSGHAEIPRFTGSVMPSAGLYLS
jgi:hypothetical protein